MSRNRSNYHGLLVVDKPGAEPTPSPLDIVADPGADPGADPRTDPDTAPDERLYTSHDVVQLVRRWSRQRRIGHTGTLDPMASGVLVLCLGSATRLVEYYQGHDKQYYAEVRLGAATDTYDAMGKVTTTATVPPLTAGDIEAVLAQFRGPIMQRPPVYSALKQGGESLHRKARRGETVKIAARPITVHALDLVDWIVPDRLQIRLCSSAGAYVRSLAHDIGQVLGTGAYLAHLRRERAGSFALDQAHGLAEIESAAAEGCLADLLLPANCGLDMPQIVLDDDQITRLGYGQTVLVDREQQPFDADGASDAHLSSRELLAQGLDPQGRFLGILRCLGQDEPPAAEWRWKAKKWFATV